MGVIIGVVVLLVSIGFVVLMMVSEWSGSKSASGMPSAEPLPARRSSKRASKAKAKKKK